MESEHEGDIGAEMARLRMGFGLSQQDVSNRLHIRVRYIQAMEENRFELLPGKVYARGYLHTYAEFLGLDPVRVVEKCLVETFENSVHRSSVSPMSSQSLRLSYNPAWKYLAVVVVAIGLLVAASGVRVTPPSDDTISADARSAVPESMLRHVRTMPMPTAWSYDCLTGQGMLACFYTDPLVDLWLHPEISAGLAYVGELDLPPPVVPAPVVVIPTPKPAATAPADENPAQEETPPEALEPGAGGVAAKPAAAAKPTKPEKPVAAKIAKPPAVARKTKPATASSVFDEIDPNAIGYMP